MLADEARLYDLNLFATHTYSNECLPKNNRLSLTTDIQKYFMRLRKAIYPYKIPIIAYSGKYAGRYNRLHYHTVILPPPPHKFIRKKKPILAYGTNFLEYSRIRS